MLLDRKPPSPDAARTFLRFFHDAFRDGNVPAGKDNLRLIRHAFLALSRVGDRAQRSLRVSACYDETVLKWLANPLSEDAIRGHIGFTISADMTKQLNACGKAVSDERSDAEPNAPFWQMLDDTRPNETAWWSEVEFTPGDWPRTATPLTLPRGPIPQASGRSVRQRSVRHVPGHRHQPRGKGRSAHPMALAEGRHHRALPRRDQERSRRRCHALRRVRGRARPGTASSDITYNILTVLKRHLLPPAEQTIKAKRLRFLAFNLAARMTSHARYLCSHVKAALLHGLAIAETRLELRLRREESHGRLGFAFAAPF